MLKYSAKTGHGTLMNLHSFKIPTEPRMSTTKTNRAIASFSNMQTEALTSVIVVVVVVVVVVYRHHLNILNA